MEKHAYSRAFAALGLAAVLIGCAPAQPKPPPPPEVIIRNCLGDVEFPDWVWEPLPIPGLAEVRVLGGTNEHMLIIFNKQAFLLDSANQRLEKLEEIIHDAIDRCRQSAT